MVDISRRGTFQSITIESLYFFFLYHYLIFHVYLVSEIQFSLLW